MRWGSEHQYVEIDEAGIRCVTGGAVQNQVAWQHLRAVEILAPAAPRLNLAAQWLVNLLGGDMATGSDGETRGKDDIHRHGSIITRVYSPWDGETTDTV